MLPTILLVDSRLLSCAKRTKTERSSPASRARKIVEIECIYIGLDLITTGRLRLSTNGRAKKPERNPIPATKRFLAAWEYIKDECSSSYYLGIKKVTLLLSSILMTSTCCSLRNGEVVCKLFKSVASRDLSVSISIFFETFHYDHQVSFRRQGL